MTEQEIIKLEAVARKLADLRKDMGEIRGECADLVSRIQELQGVLAIKSLDVDIFLLEAILFINSILVDYQSVRGKEND